MEHFEILASSFSLQGLGDEATGLAIVAGALLIGGFFVWRVARSMKKADTEDLEQERHDETFDDYET